MDGCALAIRPPPPSAAATHRRTLRPPPRNWAAGVSASLGGVGDGDTDPLLRAALRAASLRHQESLHPDPLFVDPYAGCFLSPAVGRSDAEDQHSPPMNASRPCHYTVATKFIDDKILSLLSSTEDLRQIVLLTGGMDTRPYRLSWPRSCVIYDLSPGSVSKVASVRLADIGAKISKTCLLLHVPLESSDLQTILCKKGFNGSRLSIWVLQGLPLMTLTNLKDILFTISSLAMKGSIVLGELPGWLLRTELGDTSPVQERLEKLFMSNAFQVDLVDFDEVARSLHLDPLPGDNDNVLFIAKQLRLSDSQMESWWTHLERIDGEADEEGFEEM